MFARRSSPSPPPAPVFAKRSLKKDSPVLPGNPLFMQKRTHGNNVPWVLKWVMILARYVPLSMKKDIRGIKIT